MIFLSIVGLMMIGLGVYGYRRIDSIPDESVMTQPKELVASVTLNWIDYSKNLREDDRKRRSIVNFYREGSRQSISVISPYPDLAFWMSAKKLQPELVSFIEHWKQGLVKVVPSNLTKNTKVFEND